MTVLLGFLRIASFKLLQASIEVAHIVLFLHLLGVPHALVSVLEWMARMIKAHETIAVLSVAVLVTLLKLLVDSRSRAGKSKAARQRDEQGRFAKTEK